MDAPRKPIEMDRLEDILRTYVPNIFEIRTLAPVRCRMPKRTMAA